MMSVKCHSQAANRGDLIEKRKVLMQVWADYYAAPTVIAPVAQLRRIVTVQYPAQDGNS